MNPFNASCASAAVMWSSLMSWLITRPFSGMPFVETFINVRIPWVRTDLRSKARRKCLSNGSITTPFITSAASMARR